MGMVVQHNMSAMNANRNLGVTAGNLAKSTEKLSSGYKINRAGDNAAGLAISEKMRGQIRGLDQASSNAEDGISMIQTAEGALTETHSILQRMRELSVQASSDTNTDDDRTQIQNEIDQLTQEVDRIANTTEFNTKKLLDGSRTGAVSEKDGKTSVEGNFGNSNVSATISADNTANTSFNDVIRVEITKDFTSGQNIVKDKASFDVLDKSATFTDVNTKRDSVKTAADQAKAGATNLSTDNTTPTNKNVALSDKSTEELQGLADVYAKAYAAAGGNTNDAAVKKADEALKAAFKTDDTTALTNTSVVTINGGAYGAAAQNPTGGTTVGAAATAAYEEMVTKAQAQGLELKKIADNNEIAASIVGKAYDVQVADKVATDTAAGIGKRAEDAGVLAAGKVATDVDDAVKAYVNAYVAADGDATAASVTKASAALSELFAKNPTGKVAANVTLNGKDYTTTNSKADAAADAMKEALKDAENLGSAKLAYNKTKESNIKLQDLFGSSESAKFKVADKLTNDNKLNITLTNKDGSSSTITIENADKLKAGDTLTISAKAKVESKPAASGKDALRLQVGANAGQEVSLGIQSMKAKDLNIVQTKSGLEGKALDVTTQAGASLAVNAYDAAIQKVSTERANLGATQNRLEHTISNLDTSSENLQSAESSLRDTDMAEEMTRYSKNNILMQAGQSMLAQANQSTQGVLNLLG